MNIWTALEATLLGLLEGATEFIPVSSTGHLLLVRDLIGFQGPPGFVFEIVIQLGAILAVCWVYRQKLFNVLLGLPRDPKARWFAGSVTIAFLPSMVIGALAHDFIKGVLFETLWLVCIMLIVGGFAMLAIERMVPQPKVSDVERIPLGHALGVGFMQVLAMVPGVSRSGATIMGGMLLGLDRKTAAEFSFFLAIPTMLGAATYDLYKNRDVLTFDGVTIIAIGFVVAFLAAMSVVRTVVAFIQRYGYAPFAWYRIALGAIMLIALWWS